MLRFSEEADDKIREECCPGKPFAVYQAEVSVLDLSRGTVSCVILLNFCHHLKLLSLTIESVELQGFWIILM